MTRVWFTSDYHSENVKARMRAVVGAFPETDEDRLHGALL